MKAHIGFCIIAVMFSSWAPAQMIDESGDYDYGLIQDVIVNGAAVPSGAARVLNATPQIRSVVGQDGDYDFVYCTAVLVAPDAILTAAHCLSGVNDPQSVSVIFQGGQEILIGTSIVIHPHYKKLHSWFFGIGQVMPQADLALIFLDHKVPASQVPVLLPSPRTQITSNTPAILIGFGRLSKTQSNDEGLLRWVSARVNDDGHSRLRVDGDRTVCTGDSGGPTLLPKGNRYLVIGIHSVADCSNIAYDMKVSDYTNWITDQINRHNNSRDL